MSELATVAALYVDKNGPYPKMAGVDCWDETRDARLYAGPNPVVAHPPCAAWSTLRSLCDRADERPMGLAAVAQVRRWGGVLEQPCGSGLWGAANIPMPGRGRCADAAAGYSVQVDQVRWGHVARKRTWLYLVGLPFPLSADIPEPREPTHWCSGGGTGRGKTPPGVKVCSAQQRRRTPPAFAAWLVELARSGRRP